jgi:hypothetical protein
VIQNAHIWPRVGLFFCECAAVNVSGLEDRMHGSLFVSEEQICGG